MKKLLLLFILTTAICLPLSAANGPTEKVTVGTSNISDGSISTIKLVDNAVTTDKVLDGTILNEDVATGTFARANGNSAEDFAAKDLNASGTAIVAGDFSSRLSSSGQSIVHRSYYAVVAAGAVVDFTSMGTVSSYLPSGHFYVIDGSGGVSAIISVSNGVTTKVSGNAAITATKASANAINVYVESGVIKIQNTRTAGRTVKVGFVGVL